MDVKILDTTFRDGAQSLWAMAIRHGMMEPVAEDMDNAGFHVIEVPCNAIHFKKYIRDMKENPFDIMRMLAKKMPKTPKAAMGGGNPRQIAMAWQLQFRMDLKLGRFVLEL